MIVATAGHIDHGKTLLVKRLTGVDTDRLPEEKARGISIDIGFAYLPLDDDALIGFVDVPGHERFIRNMLAGVCGIDFALLVVAADDGIMPQTVEHLQILDLLGIARGAAAITKTDRVDATRVREVADNVRALLASTGLARAPVLPVSGATGEGVDALRELLVRESAEQSARRAAGQHFRLAIDRAFSVAGAGTVVTGTVFNGSIRPGDKAQISPAGTAVRVRSIQIRGAAADQARAGQRCALNLSGAGPETIARGDWVLAEAIHRPTQRIDARVKLLAAEGQPLKHWTPVHLHLATADVTARIGIRRGETIAPGASALVRLVLDKPVGALHGDRFILRDQSANRTLGGGTVIDPFPAAARQRTALRLAELAALEAPSAGDALAALLETAPAGVDLARFEQTFNLAPEAAGELYTRTGIVAIGKEKRVGITAALRAAVREKVLAALMEFHRRAPQAPGEAVESLRANAAAGLSSDAFGQILRELNEERKIEVQGSLARIAGHSATSNPEDDRMWQAIRPALQSAGFAAPQLRELAGQLKLKEAAVRDFLHRKAKSGGVIKVGTERFYLRETMAALAAVAKATAEKASNGQFTAAQYRDATGIGRGLAIEILDVLDRFAITQRLGDSRKMRKDHEPILGPAVFPAQSPSRTPAPPQRASRSSRR